MNKANLKIAFSGSSGAGKTTLVTFLAEKLKLQHISGSAGSVKRESDKQIVDEFFHYPGGGHVGVIKYSALNSQYAMMNQKLLQMRRSELIFTNKGFITDRSPADNLTYFMNQCAYHTEVTELMCKEFAEDCLKAWNELTHVIFVKAVQPDAVEFNGSRIANTWYQKGVDTQFEYWVKNYFAVNAIEGPEILIIDFWDLERRKEVVEKFIMGKLKVNQKTFKVKE